MSSLIQLRCSICGTIIEKDEPDGYSLQVLKFGAKSPEMIWAHGPCLRKAIPVVGVEIPGQK
jgi:hypothetical protein